MKTAYFDCFSGVSGDMFSGALLDAGLEFKTLEKELEKLNLPGCVVSANKVLRGGLSGTAFRVESRKEKVPRGLKDILGIIERSGLDPDIKKTASRIFADLARVEGKIHDEPPEKVHFHEMGGIDCIVDITAALAGLKLLGIEKVFCSEINTGSGFVESAHGRLPVPSPAAAELLRGIPVYSTGTECELATPTGAAIIKHVCSGFGKMPVMKPGSIGYGAGGKDLPSPNLLRVFIGRAEQGREDESVIMVETNIDNMNPEFYGHVFERLRSRGALDVFLTPVFMKKQRPGMKLGVLCYEGGLDSVAGVIFRETTSIGIRYNRVYRKVLRRETRKVLTEYGEVGVKFAYLGNDTVNFSPEYGDCLSLSEKTGIPVKKIFDSAKAEARKWAKE